MALKRTFTVEDEIRRREFNERRLGPTAPPLPQELMSDDLRAFLDAERAEVVEVSGCPACGRDAPLRVLKTEYRGGQVGRQSVCVGCAVGLAFEAGKAHLLSAVLEGKG